VRVCESKKFVGLKEMEIQSKGTEIDMSLVINFRSLIRPDKVQVKA
jgi:hypothetical protein